MIKKIFLLTIALLCAVAQGAWAESENVTFNVRYWDTTNKQVVTTETTKEATVLTSYNDWVPLGANDNNDDHYYVVKGDVSIKTLNCFGRVHIILADGATLTLTGGLKVEKDNKAHLFIYSQSDGDSQGKLNVTNSYKRAAGIGSGEGWDCGEITIHGGILDVTGGQYAAGIGAGGSYVNTTNTEGRSTNGGTTIVYGGKVKVQGGDSGAGIGGGAGYISPSSWTSDGGYFYLYGGTVTATGGEYAAGIGGGGGKRSVLSNRYGAGGKSSKVYVYGGNLTAKGGHRAAGIGGGNNGNGWNGGWDKDFELHVYNGTVKATGGDYGAGIGGGCNCNGGKVYIYDGNVTAKGGEDAAGIGGGEDGLGGELHVSGGTVRAEGTGCGAGIGGGEYTNHESSSTQGTGANTYITGGTVIAIAGGDCKARDAKGGSAIGTGQGVKNKDDSDKAKKLEIPDNYMVTGGDAENNIERVFTNGERIDACRWRNYVKIEACPHTAQNGDDANIVTTYTQNDNGTHTAHCRYCAYTTTVAHSFENDVCTVCGKPKDASDECTVTVYQASTVNSTAYDSGTTYKVLKNTPFSLSAPAAKDGLIFMGYLKDPTTAPTSWEMKDADFTSLFDKVGLGQNNYITPTTDTKFYATYRYDYVPTWTWASDYSSATLSVTCAVLNDTQTLNVTMQEPSHTDATAEANGSDDYSASASYERVSGVIYQFSDYLSFPIAYSLSLADNASNDKTLHDNTDRKVSNLTLSDRTLYKDGSWNTLCLPFSLTAAEVTAQLAPSELKTLSSTSFNSETGTLTLNFIDATAIEAGKPYIIKWTSGSDMTNPSFSNVTIYNDCKEVTTDYVTFTGFFSPVSLEANDKTVLYLGAGNKLYYPSKAMTVNACRAVFVLNGLTAGETAKARAFKLNFGDESTGITTTNYTNDTNSDGAWYDMQGRRLSGKPSQHGIYIKNGKKVVIK